MPRASKRDKLIGQVEANIREGSLAFDALIGPLSKDARGERVVLRAEQKDVQKKEEETKKSPDQDSESASRRAARSGVKLTAVKSTTVKNTIVEIASNYCHLDLDVSDRLAAFQTPAEQVIYYRLYRLSYGEGKNSCIIGMTKLAQATGIKSSKTIARAIEGLIEKGHVTVVDGHHNNPKGGTTYRVFLPREIEGVKNKTKVKFSSV